MTVVFELAGLFLVTFFGHPKKVTTEKMQLKEKFDLQNRL